MGLQPSEVMAMTLADFMICQRDWIKAKKAEAGETTVAPPPRDLVRKFFQK